MKKIEKPIVEAVHFDNAFIATSGCSDTPTNSNHSQGEPDYDSGGAWYWSSIENNWAVGVY